MYSHAYTLNTSTLNIVAIKQVISDTFIIESNLIKYINEGDDRLIRLHVMQLRDNINLINVLTFNDSTTIKNLYLVRTPIGITLDLIYNTLELSTLIWNENDLVEYLSEVVHQISNLFNQLLISLGLTPNDIID